MPSGFLSPLLTPSFSDISGLIKLFLRYSSHSAFKSCFVKFAKVDNQEMAEILESIITHSLVSAEVEEIHIVIEHLENYGMAIGRTTFETAYFIGRLTEICNRYDLKTNRIYRHEEKNYICHSVKANDATIKRALIDRFAKNPEKNCGKGSKKEPDYFYGFKADCWSAFAICFTYCEKINDTENSKKQETVLEDEKGVNLSDLPF